ncbi:MAG: hypothetical protein MZV63_08710 [Marinilabiliales bacterium]|nr:hypothetical protein [Marinilabiliales bacterium]
MAAASCCIKDMGVLEDMGTDDDGGDGAGKLVGDAHHAYPFGSTLARSDDSHVRIGGSLQKSHARALDKETEQEDQDNCAKGRQE